jgi:hypothetical protein
MTTLLNPLPGNLLLVVAPAAGNALMMDLVARLAARGPLRLLDGGNRIDVHAISRALARGPVDLRTALGRIQLARAFTCYQVDTLLREAPARPVPTLVLDLLSTFYDESVPAAESLRLLESCILQLRRLNQWAPVAVSARPAPVSTSTFQSAGTLTQATLTGRPELLQALQAAADQSFILEPHIPPPPARLL